MPIRSEIIYQPIYDSHLRRGFKVDQRVAAEDQIETPAQSIRGVVQIEAAKTYHRTKRRAGLHLAALSSRPLEHEILKPFSRNALSLFNNPRRALGLPERAGR